MNTKDVLVALSHKHNGDWERTLKAIKAHETLTEEEAEALLGYEDAVTILEDEYPNSLRQSPKPPFVVYCHGDKSLLQASDSLTIIGSKAMKGHDMRFAKPFFENMKKKRIFVIKATNWYLAKAAMDCGHKVILVLGNGFDQCYPSDSKETVSRVVSGGGLVVSEYPNGVMPKPEHFVNLNRILTSLSKATLVLSAQSHSGTLISVAYALNMGKDVYVVPDPFEPNNQSNRLVEEGAAPLAVDTEII